MKPIHSNFIRMGVVGCGSWAQCTHLPYLLARPEVKVVGLCDCRSQRLTALADTQVERYDDFQALLENKDLDAVIISTPHALHYAQVNAALQHGLHVLVDKPLANQVNQAQKLVELAAAQDLLLGVATQRRFDPGYLRMRQIIGTGELGELYAIHGFFAQQLFDDFAGSWRSQPDENCGGILADSGYHLLDTLLWLVPDQPASLYASISCQGLKAERSASLGLQFLSGTVASLTVVRGAPRETAFEELVILGRAGCLIYRKNKLAGQRRCELSYISADGQMRLQETLRPPAGWEPTANFIDALLNNQVALLSSGADHISTVRVLQALYEAARLQAVQKLGESGHPIQQEN